MSQKQSLSKNKSAILKERMENLDENKFETEKLSNLIEEYELVALYQNIDKKNAWRKIQDKTSNGFGVQLKHVNFRWRTIAAILIPLIVVAAFIIRVQNQKTLYSFKDVKPGSAKAILELGKGEKIILPEFSNRQIFNNQGVKLGLNTNNTFICEKISTNNGGEMNLMYVPTGGEYKIVLSDETKVSVNSDSKIQFPYTFQNEKREVSLIGEAFFEVTQNKEKPFEVHTKNAIVTVLGTKFNVSSYENEQFEHITLQEGLIAVNYKDQIYNLTPGMQLIIDTKSKTAHINEVDANLYSSWKDGLFRFQNMDLVELTQKIQRWYNIKFVFKDDYCKSLRFTGAYARNANFNDFITLIESTTGVKFTPKGDKVIVSKN